MAYADERFLGPLADPSQFKASDQAKQAGPMDQVRDMMHQAITQHRGFNKSGKRKLHQTANLVVEGMQEWEATRGIPLKEAIQSNELKDEMARFVLERAKDAPQVNFDDDINAWWFEQQGFKRDDLAAIKQAVTQERERILGGGSFTEGRSALNDQVQAVQNRRRDDMIAHIEAHHEIIGEDYSSKMHDVQNIPGMSEEEKHRIATEYAEKQENYRVKKFERDFGISMDEVGLREHVNRYQQDPREVPDTVLDGTQTDQEAGFTPKPTAVLDKERSVSDALYNGDRDNSPGP